MQLVPVCTPQANAGEVSELTLGYNFGRLHEANGGLKQAQTLFAVSITPCDQWPHQCFDALESSPKQAQLDHVESPAAWCMLGGFWEHCSSRFTPQTGTVTFAAAMQL